MKLKSPAITNAHIIEKRNKSSWFLAMFLTSTGRIVKPRRNKTTINAPPPKSPFNANEPKLIPEDSEDINIKMIIATKS